MGQLYDIFADQGLRTMKLNRLGYGRWIAFSPAGRVMAVAYRVQQTTLGYQMELFDTTTGTALQRFWLGANYSETQAFRGDGGLLAVGVRNEGVRVYGCK